MTKKRKRSSVGASNPHYSNSPVPLARASTTWAIQDKTCIGVNFKSQKLVSDERMATVRRFADFIVQDSKRFLSFLVRLKTPNIAAEFSAYVLTRKRSANQRKKYSAKVFF